MADLVLQGEEMCAVTVFASDTGWVPTAKGGQRRPEGSSPTAGHIYNLALNEQRATV